MGRLNELVRRFYYSYNDLTALEEFLEQHAAEGRMLNYTNGFTFKFEQAIPKK